MSGADDEDDGPGRREVAYRLFAAEFDDATLEHAESDRERAPNYVITPTGARVNRLFVVGVLTEVEPVSDEVRRARVVDPTGAFVLYAGQYQPDERAFLERAEPPAYVAVTGKARTFRPDDADRVFTSVRPESISVVDADARDRWTVDAAERTLERIQTMATALALEESGSALRDALEADGVDAGHADGITLAIDHYGTTPTYLAAVRRLAIDTTRLVAGDLDEVAPLDVNPDEAGDITSDALLGDAVDPVQTAPDEVDAEETETVASSTSSAETIEDPSTDEESIDPDPAEPVSEPGDFEIDEAERESIEAEFGTEFQSGTEVDDPGEADIDTPETPPEPDDDAESARPPDESGEPDGEDVELVEVTVSAMEDLDGGDGADRTAVIETVTDRTGADPDAVEAAIQDALMDGRCYEPDDATLKPI